MVETNAEKQFNAALCERVRELREAKKWTGKQMATALGIPAERYRKYEERSPLPSYLMERFCLITGVSLEYLLHGQIKQPIARIRN